MKRTFGAAIGAALFVMFMSYIATRLVSPVSASNSYARAQQTAPQR